MGERCQSSSSQDDCYAHPVRDSRVKVRGMRCGDIPTVLEIERCSFPSPWSERAFMRELKQNRYAEYIVAEHEDTVIGYAGMWLFVHETHVTNIAVCSDWRGRGVGGHLLRSLMKMAARRGIGRMTLEVRMSNEGARRFYRTYGFKTGGVRRNYYSDTGEDAVIMYCEDVRAVLDTQDA